MAATWFYVGLFLAASFLMVWRLEVMARYGIEGTVLGTIIMPYCTGFGNLVFVIVLGNHGGSGSEVVTNCLVNNVTNLTLLIGLPLAIWGLSKNARQTSRVDRLSVLLTLLAVLLFTGVTWALGRRGTIGFGGGLILVGLFLGWQACHVSEIMRTKARRNRSFPRKLALDLILLAVGAYGTWLSTDRLVEWVSNIKTGFISERYIGWLSGWMDVLPNGVLAFYYGWKRRPEIVYTSQIGDGHICIPLCVGIAALYRPVAMPAFFQTGILILGVATLVHLLFIGAHGRLPRRVAFVLTAVYGIFLYEGLLR